MTPADTGGRKPRVTDKDLLAVFRDAEDPVLSTAEVADAVPIKRRGTLNRLRDLEDAGDLESKQIGGRNTAWWLADLLDVTSDRSETRAETPPTDPVAESTDTRRESDALDAALDGWEPDTEADASTARAQTRRAAEYLRAKGDRRTRSDFVDALADESTLGARSWWERAVQPGLRRLEAEGLVEYRPGHHDYRWLGSGEP